MVEVSALIEARGHKRGVLHPSSLGDLGEGLGHVVGEIGRQARVLDARIQGRDAQRARPLLVERAKGIAQVADLVPRKQTACPFKGQYAAGKGGCE